MFDCGRFKVVGEFRWVVFDFEEIMHHLECSVHVKLPGAKEFQEEDIVRPNVQLCNITWNYLKKRNYSNIVII